MDMLDFLGPPQGGRHMARRARASGAKAKRARHVSHRARVSGAKATVAQPVGASRYLRSTLFCAALAVLVGVLYVHTLDGPFVFDDVRNIQKNIYVHVTHLSVDSLLRAAFQSPERNRPV